MTLYAGVTVVVLNLLVDLATPGSTRASATPRGNVVSKEVAVVTSLIFSPRRTPDVAGWGGAFASRAWRARTR